MGLADRIREQILEAKGLDLKDNSDEDVFGIAKGLGYRLANLEKHTREDGQTFVYLKTPNVTVRNRSVKGLYFRLGSPGSKMDVDAAREAIKIMRRDLAVAEMLLNDIEGE